MTSTACTAAADVMRARLVLAFVLILAGCLPLSPGSADEQLSLHEMIEIIVAADDGAIGQAEKMLSGTFKPLPKSLHDQYPTSHAYISSDGYAIEKDPYVGFGQNGRIYTFSFLLVGNKCFPISSIPGIAGARRGAVYDGAVPFAYHITKPAAQIDIYPQAKRSECLGGVIVQRKGERR